jgi:hypothetical protein
MAPPRRIFALKWLICRLPQTGRCRFKVEDGVENYSTIKGAPDEDPGVRTVREIYDHFRCNDIQTILMAASFRNVEQIKALVRLVVPPRLPVHHFLDQTLTHSPTPFLTWPHTLCLPDPGWCRPHHHLAEVSEGVGGRQDAHRAAARTR